jgi:hypothetical protein
MLLHSRILLQRSSLLPSLALKNHAGRHSRQFAAVTSSNHLHFLEKFKCSSNNRSFEKDHVQTITGLLLGNRTSTKSLVYQQTNLFHISHINFLAQKVSNSNDSKTLQSKSDEKNSVVDEKEAQDEKPLGLVAKFKKMAKEYWYVLIPVHIITSCCWFGGFYYASIS